MLSPRFPFRAEELQDVFSRSRLASTWRNKVRYKLRNQLLPDPIEHLDTHRNLAAVCQSIERKVLGGSYAPASVRRVLAEKSKGLCRQLVVPSAEDALVLQCLSDSLYSDIKGKAPSPQAYFEPDDQRFNQVRADLFAEPRYGTFKSWLNFQRAVFRFPDNHNYVVVTDIANYYDFISYTHLRNIISGTVPVRESVLDMLIYILSGFLWQPDYTPRIEIGLPQINLDAPRILAHCFLYELDKFLQDRVWLSFVRFMDDIDFGVDTIAQAKEILRDVDLVLQTRQVRLNSGKTQILTAQEAGRYFRVHENAVLDLLASRINSKIKSGASLARERKHLSLALSKMYWRGDFDTGAGEKILKRMLSSCRHTDTNVPIRILKDIVNRRPGSRDGALSYMASTRLTPSKMAIVRRFITSKHNIDHLSGISCAATFVDGRVRRRWEARPEALAAMNHLAKRDANGVYAALWIGSKFADSKELLDLIGRTRSNWEGDGILGRLVGGLSPCFANTSEETAYRNLLYRARNPDALKVLSFHDDIREEPAAYSGIRSIVEATNPSNPLAITHPKLLIILSVFANPRISTTIKSRLITNHKLAWSDALYRRLARQAITPTSLRSNIKP